MAIAKEEKAMKRRIVRRSIEADTRVDKARAQGGLLRGWMVHKTNGVSGHRK